MSAKDTLPTCRTSECQALNDFVDSRGLDKSQADQLKLRCEEFLSARTSGLIVGNTCVVESSSVAEEKGGYF